MFWAGLGAGIVACVICICIWACCVTAKKADEGAEKEHFDKESNPICWSCTHYGKQSTEDPCTSCTDGFSKWQRNDNIGELVGQDRD